MKPRVDYYETLTGKCQGRSMETIRARKRYLHGVGTGFELAQGELRANPSRAFCEGKERWRLILLLE